MKKKNLNRQPNISDLIELIKEHFEFEKEEIKLELQP